MINVSFIGVIILKVYVACLCSTDPDELPALNLIKSGIPKQFQTITMNQTGGLTGNDMVLRSGRIVTF